ncbi:S-adenosyl-L-methionine-dependent methyltransferase [Umbelopsis sp. PMI_123]|nr:S-adenosyl-L-methionine-dependent methyltransferase [Umbelopsis sp. PMI_123]
MEGGEFKASQLGTKQYWDSMYVRENVNFEEIGDIGEVWFGEDSVEKMVDWVTDNIEPNTKSIIDLGCGNGHLLLALAENGFQNLHGIDYSPSAIQLAKSVAKQRDMGFIEYDTVDFLNEDDWRKSAIYDIVLDKGTYDAICLDPAQEEANQKGEDGPKERYVEKVRQMIAVDGRFLITSCNWTREELIRDFGKYFVYSSHVKYPTFSFGGQTGSKICTVAFTPK